MEYHVRYGNAAEREYRSEFSWSVRQWGKGHALEYWEKVRNTIERLAVAPHAYPRPVGAKADYRVVPLEGLRIAYHIDDPSNTVTVLALVGRNRYHELEAKVMRAMNDLLQ